ncbi:uncharacterized protein SPSC_05622 [Sporisorium scitamineum]|nr:uncharacterized protein SPSC_05622 [Sporisorium scitamineum]
MRHRMLGLPPYAPHAYDLPESDTFSTNHTSVSDDERTTSQRDFVSWLSRPPVEFSVSNVDVDSTADILFTRRLRAMHDAQLGDSDPIDVGNYQVYCCDAWHDHRRLLVRFPEQAEESASLYLMVIVGEEGEMRLDNLFATKRDIVLERGLHRWTLHCSATKETRQGEAEDADQGAEYINDADDFWAGFSDDEDAGGKAKETDAGVVVDATVGGGEGEGDQEQAIRDIIRGAYTLHRSIRTSADSVEDFIRLVRSTITPP